MASQSAPSGFTEMDNQETSFRDSVFGKRLDGSVLKGMSEGRAAFSGPHILQLDLTNNCNFNCVGCWCHSDLLGEDRFSAEKKAIHIDIKRAIELIAEIRETGTQRIILSGSGEPMAHPGFMEVAREIRRQGLDLEITTNFSLASEAMIRELVDIGTNTITVSIWAGTPETYARLHPNQPDRTFERILSNLDYLYSLKTEVRLPKIRLYNVISSENYNEISQMLDIALKAKADYVEYQAVDIIPGRTDRLALSLAQAEEILRQLDSLRSRDDYFIDLAGEYAILHDRRKDESREFGRFYKDTLPPGFILENISCKLRCPHGFISSRRVLDTETGRSFVYSFAEKFCRSCSRKGSCLAAQKPIHLEFLNLLGYGSFARRINNPAGAYDESIVNSIPCFVGWTYARILPDGSVIPCCKAHKHPLGNINKHHFGEIWFSPAYDEFREKAKGTFKANEYFSRIQCTKSCDNVGMNIEAGRQLSLDPNRGRYCDQ